MQKRIINAYHDDRDNDIIDHMAGKGFKLSGRDNDGDLIFEK